MEFEQCCKVFDISPELDSIRSWQKISLDLVGGHYIFPNELHFIESVVPLEYPNRGHEAPKHGVRRTILPISTPFFITESQVRRPSMGYGRRRTLRVPKYPVRVRVPW